MSTANPKLPSTFDTLALRARFVTEELRRLRLKLQPEDLEGEVPGLDEAIKDCGEACCDLLREPPKELKP